MKRFDIDDVVIHAQLSENLWIFRAKWCGYQVGEAKCTCKEGRVCLSDIKVEDSLEVYSNFIHEILAKIKCLSERRINFQRRGIGATEVIKCFQESDMDELYGFIIASDEQQISELRNWYREKGFDILPLKPDCIHSDSDCIPSDSVARIVMRKLQ